MAVLLVDDSAVFRDGLRRLLTRGGYTIGAEAEGGEQAIALMKSRHFDTVILDLHMPAGDGFTVLHHIQTLAARPQVVVVTAHVTSEVRHYCTELGAFRVLNKFDVASQLLPVIDELTQARRR